MPKKINCNLCGQDDTKLLFLGRDRLSEVDKTEFNIVKCKNCGLVYLNPQPTLEELVKYYPESYGPYVEKGMFKYGPISRLLKAVLQRMRGNKLEKSDTTEKDQSVINYLDFGCGDGKEMEQTKKLHPNWRISGLDNSEIACERARARGFEVYCGDVSEVNLPDEHFDRVMMASVVEHVNDPRYVMSRINKTMKKGGEVIVRTPNFDSLAGMIFGRFWYALDTPRHLYLFSTKTLSRLLEETGFRIQKIEYKEGPFVEIKSFYYLIKKKDRRMNPIVWRLLMPITNLLVRRGLASTQIIYAEKA